MNHLRRALWLLALLAAPACVSDDPAAVLTATVAIAPGEQCPAGGTLIATGEDDDGDGALTPAEHDDTRTVCFDAPADDLVSVVDEPAGANCEHGGQAVRSGADDDGDGVLAEAEIDDVEYVCAAAPQTPDAPWLSQTRPATAEECPFGGTAIEGGADADGDGVLGDAEVSEVETVCAPAPQTPDAPWLSQTRPATAEECPFGGTAIEGGADADGDGGLDAGEITAVETVCSPPPVSPAPWRTRTRAATEGECAAGGTVVEGGADADGDGALGDAEVLTTDLVCQPAPGIRVRVDVVAAGATCEHGGLAINAGHDDDGDGVLDDAEIETTSEVCAAAPGEPPAVLVTVTDEPPGARCPLGGHAVSAGRDDDGDGVLDDAEIADRDVVCNPGGELTRRDREPAGTSCPRGGTVYLTGVDDDGDLVLDDAEVDERRYVCIDGSGGCSATTIATDEDLRRAQGCTRIGGTLRLKHGEVELPNLIEVTGDVRLDTPTTVASFPALTAVDRIIVESPWLPLEEVSAPLLAAGDVVLWYQAKLARVELGAAAKIDLKELSGLTEVVLHGRHSAGLHIKVASRLTTLRADELTTATELELSRLPTLTSVDGLRQLTSVESLLLSDLDVVPAVDLSRLTAVQDLGIHRLTSATSLRAPSITGLRHLRLTTLPALVTVELPASLQLAGLSFTDVDRLARLPTRVALLAGGSLSIADNEALEDLADLSVAPTMSSLTVRANPRLTSLAVLSGITELTGTLWVDENPLLTTASFRALRGIGSNVFVRDNVALTTLELPVLDLVGASLYITGNPLRDLDLGGLTRVHGLTISGVAGGAISVPRLTESPSTITVSGNPGAHAIDLSALVSTHYDLRITDNGRVEELRVPALRTIGVDLHIHGNPRLPHCQALAAREQLTSIGQTAYIYDNDSSARCE